jgi:hypothetical protein
MRRLFYRIFGTFIVSPFWSLDYVEQNEYCNIKKTGDSHAARLISRAETFQLFFWLWFYSVCNINIAWGSWELFI